MLSNCSISYTDIKPLIVKYILKRWLASWDQQIHNKLHEVHSLVGKTPCSYNKIRNEQVVLTRCRIGHSRLTHSYLLNNEERPECINRIQDHPMRSWLPGQRLCSHEYLYD
jgi:hypothetical protein